MYILYAFQCEILPYTINLRAVLGPSKIINMKNFKFLLLFLPTICPLTQSLFMFLTCVFLK